MNVNTNKALGLDGVSDKFFKLEKGWEDAKIH